MLKSTHKAFLALLEEAHKAECNHFESRISELRDHLASVKRLVFSPTVAEPTPIAREVDAVLTPVNDTPIYSPVAEDDLREQNLIFSGEYDVAHQ